MENFKFVIEIKNKEVVRGTDDLEKTGTNDLEVLREILLRRNYTSEAANAVVHLANGIPQPYDVAIDSVTTLYIN